MTLPDNPIAAVIVAALFILLGGGAGGAFVALRKDRRQGDKDEVDLAELVRVVAGRQISDLDARVAKFQEELRIANERHALEVSALQEQVNKARDKAREDVTNERERSDREIDALRTRMYKRINQLEDAIRAIPGGVVPPWPKEDTA